MRTKSSGLDDIDISAIKNRERKTIPDDRNTDKSKDSFRPEFIKPTESDIEDSLVEEVPAPEISGNDEQRQRRSAAFNGNYRYENEREQELRTTPNFRKRPQRQPNPYDKLSNINLTNSIPFTGIPQHSSQSQQPPNPKNPSQNHTLTFEQRKHKIFPQNEPIKFQLPTLDEYYTKSKLESSMNISMGLNANDQAEMMHKQQMEGSSYSFLGFRNQEKENNGNHNNNHKFGRKMTIGQSMFQTMNMNNNMDHSRNGGMNLGFGRATKLMSKNTYNTIKDEIKEESYEGEENSTSKIKENQPVVKDYKVKGVYLLLGFLLSTIVMILIRNFT